MCACAFSLDLTNASPLYFLYSIFVQDPSTLSPSQQSVHSLLTSPPSLAPLPAAFAPVGNPINPTHQIISPLAFGCETYNIPVLRKRAEAWRHFDVDGIVAHQCPALPPSYYDGSEPDTFSSSDLLALSASLEESRVLLPLSSLSARLVYLDGKYVPSLSQPSAHAYDLVATKSSLSSLPPHLSQQFERLPDGASDSFPYSSTTKRNPIPLSVLSGIDHMPGPFNCQFAVNTQQGTAAFAALNTLKLNSLAVVDVPSGTVVGKPIQVARLYTDAGVSGALHSRLLCHLASSSSAELLQSVSSVPDSTGSDSTFGAGRDGPTLYNSYTQVMVGENSTLVHRLVSVVGGEEEEEEDGRGGGGGRTL